MYKIVFGLIAIVLARWIYIEIYPVIWPLSLAHWLFAASVVTAVYYGLDKGLCKVKWLHTRIPVDILNALAIAGGFPGAWFGMVVFHHKINAEENRRIRKTLILSTIVYCVVAYLLTAPH